jgi:hypothetical protein
LRRGLRFVGGVEMDVRGGSGFEHLLDQMLGVEDQTAACGIRRDVLACKARSSAWITIKKGDRNKLRVRASGV